MIDESSLLDGAVGVSFAGVALEAAQSNNCFVLLSMTQTSKSRGRF